MLFPSTSSRLSAITQYFVRFDEAEVTMSHECPMQTLPSFRLRTALNKIFSKSEFVDTFYSVRSRTLEWDLSSVPPVNSAFFILLRSLEPPPPSGPHADAR